MDTDLQTAYVAFGLKKLQEIYKASKTKDQPCDFLHPRLLFLTIQFHDLPSDPERSADAADGITKVFYKELMTYALNGHIDRKWPRQAFMMTFIDKEGSGSGYRDQRATTHLHAMILLNDAVREKIERIMILTGRVSTRTGAPIYTLKHRYSRIGIRQVDICYIEPMTLARVIRYAGKVATDKIVDESGTDYYPHKVNWDRWLSFQRGQYSSAPARREMSISEIALAAMMQRRRTDNGTKGL